MEDRFTQVVGAAVILIIGVFVFSSIVATSPTVTDTVTNESITVNHGEYVAVDNASVATDFSQNVTVYNSSGSELTEGTDYEWAATNGSVKFLAAGSTTDGNTANITYTYTAHTENVRTVTGTVSSAFQLAGTAVLVVVAALILRITGTFGGSGRR
jgi:hypothetical protein